jgi:hypothetical protein
MAEPIIFVKDYGEVARFSDGTTVVRWNDKVQREPITIFPPDGFNDQPDEDASKA